MWDRCHWRFLYFVASNSTSLNTYVAEKASNANILDMFKAMNQDESIYSFATKCGSWDWAGIGIMLACCKSSIVY